MLGLCPFPLSEAVQLCCAHRFVPVPPAGMQRCTVSARTRKLASMPRIHGARKHVALQYFWQEKPTCRNTVSFCLAPALPRETKGRASTRSSYNVGPGFGRWSVHTSMHTNMKGEHKHTKQPRTQPCQQNNNQKNVILATNYANHIVEVVSRSFGAPRMENPKAQARLVSRVLSRSGGPTTDTYEHTYAHGKSNGKIMDFNMLKLKSNV